ncbi:MAG: T9SS type A sorting domain-containing protein [Candidatus Cloacimonadaceae bacterium]|nr:T9SS type A sorting domain-containing protein [Candidatus Cloacimonadaceae bacterium]
MKKLLIIGMICFVMAQLPAIIVETASLKNFLFGSEPACAYDNWLSHVAEGIAVANYNLYAPYDRQTNGFGDFRVPNAADLLYWNNMLDLFMVGEYDAAQTILTNAGAPFQIVQFNDLDSGRTYYMIRELPNMTYSDDNGTPDPYDDEIGAFLYGWGLFIYNPQATRPVIITLPHPCDDFTTLPIGYEAFQLWNAQSLLINGAGREVKWTNVPPYTNAKSISDPTRLATHPYNYIYKKFADTIRAELNIREFSVQIHSYDWNRHVGMTDTQISAGYLKLCPNLPIRDLSRLKHDLINRGSHLMIPANTVGTHRDVYLNDFYSVNYEIHDFTFDDGEHQYAVNNVISLPAYSLNQQMLYTLSGWNDYDAYEPFFHIEMDELPNAYVQDNVNYHWFYGFNVATQRWDYANLFTNTVAYYSRWVEDMDSILDEMFEMNDGQAPETPTNLTVLNQSMNYITLSWNRSYDYDFDTYEVLYATQPIGLGNYQIFDRNNASFLASQACETISVSGLTNANQYYFRIRGKDKNGNYSSLSNEVMTIPAPANITAYNAYGMDSAVRLYWQVGGQMNNQGFKVYKKIGDAEYQLADSYATNPALTIPTASAFEWWDNNVSNNSTYTYKISSTNGNNVEFYHNYPAACSPRAIHFIRIQDAGATLADSIAFGNNPYATDGQDNYYDVSKNNPASNYVWNAFWQQYWGSSGTQLAREIKGYYNLDTNVKSWTMRTRSDLIGQNLTISASSTFGRAEKLYLNDGGAGTWHNLMSGPYQYSNANSNVRTMTLVWGNMQPSATHNAQANKVFQGGSNIHFSWSYTYPFLIDHAQISIISDTDSLLVSSLVTNSQYNTTFMVPYDADMQNARIVIDIVAIDGVRSRYYSSYTFALVPYMVFVMNEDGWKMRSNPWPANALTFEQMFGTGATGSTYNGSMGWGASATFSFGSAYLVNNPEYAFYSTTSPIQSEEISFGLNPGWSFIPNPHLCAYNVKDIRFILNGNFFRFGELINQNLISRGVYVFRNGGYELADRIEPYEAFLIKYYGGANLAPQINFYPFFDAPQITPPAANWSLKVNVSATGKHDSMILGSHHLATDGYDFKYDLPKPLLLPVQAPYVRLLRILESDSLFIDHHLYSEYRSLFSASIDEEKVWNFRLQLATAEPVAFTFNQIGIQPGWQILFMIEGVPHYVGSSPEFVFSPNAPGTYNGYIRVSNYPVSNNDLVMTPLSGLKAYPNPFNPNVNIAFNMAIGTDVAIDIYNIRGQKVRYLFNGRLSGGYHSFLWNGKDSNNRSVGSGIYFARVQTKAKTHILKMMLMK